MNNIERLSKDYLDYKSKFLAENSQRAYDQNIRFLLKRCNSLNGLTRKNLNKIINESGKLKTKNLRKAVVDNFVEWCVKEKYLDEVIDTEVYKTRAEKYKTNILAIKEHQLEDLVSEVEDRTIKDILTVGFYMGLRISEIIHCRPSWIIEDKFLRVGDLYVWDLEDEFHPKSQKEYDKSIAIPKKVTNVFERRVKNINKYDRIFGYNSDSTLRQHLKCAFRFLPKPFSNNFTPHHLRHSCISYWLNEKRVPLQEVQRLARHARMETTLRYYHPDNEAHLEAFS